ncbi:MAG TPA: hypothetical protein VN323_19650, partial [Candidatus Dormibacteraeota bacterium]|nr:hypothetical protein [Candidatus Dormibacteraeota bacterium]
MRPDPGVLVSRILRGWCAASAGLALLAGAGALASGWGRPAAAICFLLCGGALLARRNPPGSPRLRAVADLAAGLAAVVAVVALVGR